MSDFFPAGFWYTVAMVGMCIFFVFGVDLLFGSKLVSLMSRLANKTFHFDQAVVSVLTELKKASDREVDVEKKLLQGWGRFVMSGLLLFGAGIILLNLLPRL